MAFDPKEINYNWVLHQLNGGLTRDRWVYVNAEYRDGQIIATRNGKPLNLSEGSTFQIRLPTSTAYELGLNTQPETVPFISKSCSVFYGIRKFHVTTGLESSWIWNDGLVKQYKIDPSFPVHLTKRDTTDEYLWTEIKLLENLWLIVRVDKDAKLLPAVVYVPGSERQFPSLNSAVTACVKDMQTNRKSTSTNVFRNCIAQIDGTLYGFESLRLNALGQQALPFQHFLDEPSFNPQSRLRLSDD